MQYKASAPGSLMLLGEYAVLNGKPALVCAVNKRIIVALTPREDRNIEIYSRVHGLYITDIEQMKIEKPFHFVVSAIQQYQGKMQRGCNIEITSEFSDKIGFSSSAAVTAATLAAMNSWLNIKVSSLDLIRQGAGIVRSLQGVGSGADIAACVHGGIVGYQATPLVAEKFSGSHPLSVIYSGFKTPTVEAIKCVQNKFAEYPNLFRELCNSIGRCAAEGILCLRKNDWAKLGAIMTIQQGLMDSLGVNMPLLHDMVEDLISQPGILGAKISGSGLGDCVVGLGVPASSYLRPELKDRGVKYIPVEMALQGVVCEKS